MHEPYNDIDRLIDLATLITNADIPELLSEGHELGVLVAAAAMQVSNMRNALLLCERCFTKYELDHLAKGTPEGNVKAELNSAMRETCALVLAGNIPTKEELWANAA